MTDINSILFSSILNRNIVIEEKVDGSCVGIGFEHGKASIRHRNQEVRGEQWDLLKSWVSSNEEELYLALDERYIMYGEWLYAKHTIPYDNLPHFFLEYDIYDTSSQEFLSTPRRKRLLSNTSVSSVRVLGDGLFKSHKEIVKLLGSSGYRRNGPMEGLYVKIEEDGKVVGRYKYIRKEFLDQILDSGSHWSERELEKNQLSKS